MSEVTERLAFLLGRQRETGLLYNGYARMEYLKKCGYGQTPQEWTDQIDDAYVWYRDLGDTFIQPYGTRLEFGYTYRVIHIQIETRKTRNLAPIDRAEREAVIEEDNSKHYSELKPVKFPPRV